MAADLETAQKTVAELQDEGTAELEASIANIDAINVKVRANADKVRAQQEADELSANTMTCRRKSMEFVKQG